MEVILARAAGFCYGVKRACRLAFAAVEEPDRPVSSLGPIIHNPQLVDRLAEAGVRVVEGIDEVDSGAVLIRSHGVPPEVYEQARAKGLNIIDATCPLVRRAQKLARALAEEGYLVVVVGEPDHPEVVALAAWAGDGARVVDSSAEVAALGRRRRVGVVAQTTRLASDYQRLVGELLAQTDELKAYNTICNATARRQAAMLELSATVDGMVVVGGKNSANTTRLYHHCLDRGKRAWHIETAEELDPAWFAGMHRLGVTAGASTPDWIIADVIARLRSI